jgi:hypothetical protein
MYTNLDVMDGTLRKKQGEASLCDKAKLERPVTATDESYHEHVEEMIQENHEIKQKATAIKVGISKERVGHIINLLRLQKVCARWVP